MAVGVGVFAGVAVGVFVGVDVFMGVAAGVFVGVAVGYGSHSPEVALFGL